MAHWSSRLLGRLLGSLGVKTYFILERDPLIIYIGNRFQHTLEVAELFRDRPVHFIRNNWTRFGT